MKKLSKNDIIFLHENLIEIYGGDEKIRDHNLLDLSANSPYQTFDGVDLYEGIIEKAVHLCFSLIMNHPFVDGNKRIGAHCLLILLDSNGITLDYQQDELIEIILDIASSRKNEEALLNWVKDHKL